MKRPLLHAAAGGLAIVAAITAGTSLRASLTQPPPGRVITAPVTIGDVEETVLASGTVKPVKIVAVGSQASGRITTLHVAVGDTVRKDDPIAEIESVTQRNNLRTAEADLADKRAQKMEKEAVLEKAELTLTRCRRLVATSALSRADLDSAEADVKATRAQLAALEAKIVQAEVAVETAVSNLAHTRITAPIGGTVLAVVNQEGQTLNAVQSAPTVVVLGQLDTMTVRAEISEADVVKVRPGQYTYFTILGAPEQRFETTLASIEPAPESITKDSSLGASASSTQSGTSSSSSEAIYYNGVLTIANTDGRLRTSMTAEVHIVIDKVSGVPAIPVAALGARGADGRYTVQVVDSFGHISVRKVETGLNNKVMVQVRSGLEPDELVVVGEANNETPTTAKTMRPPPPPMGF